MAKKKASPKKKVTSKVSAQLNKAINNTASKTKSKTVASETKRIAKASGIKPTTLNQIKRGEINPPPHRKNKIAKATPGVSASSLASAKKTTVPKRKKRTK